MRFRRGIVLVGGFAAAAGLFLAAGCSNLAWYRHGESSRWAAADDPVAKTMIDAERKWAEAGCDHNGIAQTILAEDFHAVAPDGSEYGKKEAVAEAANTKTSERDCKLLDVKVHFFKDKMAVLYGSETAIHPAAAMPDGKEQTVKLTWVDTWLKRDGKWQIVAAEDMPSEAK